MAGRQVFICAAAEDAGYYGELITALNAWEVPHFAMGVVPNPVVSMPPTIESEIRQCEVFLRVCTAHTRQSNAVKLATDAFQRLLEKDRRGPRQRRRLVNLILDPAYLLDEEEKKTLYIMAPGKSRPLWLEELAVSLGAATLTQQLSRRALFGMGAGAAVAVASAGVAGTLLVKQFQLQQPPPLPLQESISGNPRFNFSFFQEPTKQTYGPARVFQDGATTYAQPALGFDSFDKLTTTKVVDDTVYVLSTADGKKRHIKIPPVPGYGLNQSELLAVSNGIMLFHNLSPDSIPLAPNQTTILRAVRASDGKQIWKVTTAAKGTPVIADGVVYWVLQDVTKTDGSTIYYQTSLNAFSMHDGKRIWRNADYSFDTILTPAVADGRLYIGSYLDQDHNVYCLDAKTGKKLWSYLTRGAVLGTPTIANGVVYVGSQDNALYALDAKTGALHWRFDNSLTFQAAPLVVDGVVYAPSQDGYVYALDARTGTLFWRAFAGGDPATDSVGFGTLTAQVAIYRNVLFATNDDTLCAFDLRHGAQRWRYTPVASESLTAPVMSNGLVLIGASDNHVYAINP